MNFYYEVIIVVITSKIQYVEFSGIKCWIVQNEAEFLFNIYQFHGNYTQCILC